MSVTEEQPYCPLCMETLEVDDLNFYPCTCFYQICRFCWHRIREEENGLCPACRQSYPENPVGFKPLTQEEITKIKSEKKAKDAQKKQKISESRKHLANVRVVQKNLVFVVGLSPRLADGEVLKKPEYFGKFGKIHKIVVNHATSYAGAQGPSASAYVTYCKVDDALRAIQAVNNVYFDGRTLKASLGTTKYCSHFLKNQQCPKPDCMYLHELGDGQGSFTKEDMQQGKHQEYERKLHEALFASCNGVDKDKPKENTRKTSTPSPTSTVTPPPTSSSPPDSSSVWPALNNNKPDSPKPSPSDSPHSDSKRNMSPNKETDKKFRSSPVNKTEQKSSPTTPPSEIESDTRSRSNCFPATDSMFRQQQGFPIQAHSSINSGFNATSHNHIQNTIVNSHMNSTAQSLGTDWLRNTDEWGMDHLSKSDDELGFDPFAETSKALEEMIEHERQEQRKPKQPPPGFSNHYTPQQQQLPPIHNDFGLHPYLNNGTAMNSQPPNHLLNKPSNNSDPYGWRDWQDELRNLLPNINISFGQTAQQQQQNMQHINKGWTNSLTDWTQLDPAIVSSGNLSNTQHPESPPHWISALEQLTESTTPPPSYPHYSPLSHWQQHPPPGFTNHTDSTL